jgi:hypothetical protein
MPLIKGRLKLDYVQDREIKHGILSALTNQILKNTVSTMMIQPSVRPLEISA